MQDLGELAIRWERALAQELPAAVELRHRLHADPRVSGEEGDTTDAVAHAMGVRFHPVAATGGWARVGPAEGPAVAIRGELDALPGVERTGAAWVATNGAMHACGHDIHLAALTALTRAAAQVDLPVALVPVLQPREEAYPSGTEEIVQAGVLIDQRVAAAIAAHVHHDVPRGCVATGAGAINAAADEFHLTLHGTGGHGAYPHRAADPVTALAAIVMGLPELVRRTVSPMVPALLSVGSLRAGDGAANVLPADATLRATMRTTRPEDRTALKAAVYRLVESTAHAYGVSADLSVHAGEPVLSNDPDLAAGMDRWLPQLGLCVAPPMRSLGADDFSHFGDQVPILMSFVGVYADPDPSRPTLHDMAFLPADDVVADVARAMLAGYLAAVESIETGVMS